MIQLEKLAEFDGHPFVARITDPGTGLRGFIAIHDTTLGPAVGGTRYYPYRSEEEALKDALRLSRAMTYKCAVAGVPYGGGKAVLVAPKGAGTKKSEAYLAAYARRLKFLNGNFYTGEDVGMIERDIEVLASHSNAIVGRPAVGGLPAQFAALSVFRALETALQEETGSASLLRKTVAIKGLGNVGMDLAGLLHDAGASLVAADVDEARVREAKKKFPDIRIVSPARIHREAVDIYAPCALGGEFTPSTVRQLGAKIVCGAANNQLANDKMGAALAKRGVLYIPDYVANAGGLISVVDELNVAGYSEARVRERIGNMRSTVSRIIRDAKAKKLPTSVVADELVREKLRSHNA